MNEAQKPMTEEYSKGYDRIFKKGKKGKKGVKGKTVPISKKNVEGDEG